MNMPLGPSRPHLQNQLDWARGAEAISRNADAELPLSPWPCMNYVFRFRNHDRLGTLPVFRAVRMDYLQLFDGYIGLSRVCLLYKFQQDRRS
ncbi:hypothetical protein M406DRAFT_101619 [Cryphonectria parasitica EP155]|uniref:Uncharacterized protein n=1 Tax=Cryphonectria parasitica (strain ATCC 38755 / EP155) TaxID=660469 RepID=A0A9P4Y501_CRYP1|nr:uncharacterized protein M406DRAFT_101619 [Cryphonectria parasitica EP155]KAF3766245.1 hypothetical protein M406DRAFT_101619 [Cryphonectria parasitica EP155]